MSTTKRRLSHYEQQQELRKALLDLRYALLREAWPFIRLLLRFVGWLDGLRCVRWLDRLLRRWF